MTIQCVQCGKEIKIVGFALMRGADLDLVPNVSLFSCLNESCPNFRLVQMGLSEVEK